MSSQASNRNINMQISMAESKISPHSSLLQMFLPVTNHLVPDLAKYRVTSKHCVRLVFGRIFISSGRLRSDRILVSFGKYSFPIFLLLARSLFQHIPKRKAPDQLVDSSPVKELYYIACSPFLCMRYWPLFKILKSKE